MRRHILFTLFAFTSLIAFSQVKIGLRAGGAINSFNINAENYYTHSSAAGYVVGATVDAMFPSTPLGVDASVLFSWRDPELIDYCRVGGVGNGEGTKRDLARGYMEFPILLKWKIIDNGIVAPHIATGPNFTFLCGKQLSSPFKKNGNNTGWQFSVGLCAKKHFQLDLSYGIGLAKAFERINIVGKDDKNFVETYAHDRYARATLSYYF